MFQGKLGTIKEIKTNIMLKDDAVPKFCKFRPVLSPLRKQEEEELDKTIADATLSPALSGQRHLS